MLSDRQRISPSGIKPISGQAGVWWLADAYNFKMLNIFIDLFVYSLFVFLELD